ncbi:MAG TPA: hypothetical protein DCL44_00525 [Elusimicrobia bacterium]|nr:hypothetical protein [Elusimicrobiota bacterium]
MKIKYPVLTMVLFTSTVIAFRLPNYFAQNVSIIGDFKDAVADNGSEKFNTTIPDFKDTTPTPPVPAPAEAPASQPPPDELENLGESEGMSPSQDLLTLYLNSWISDQVSPTNTDPNEIPAEVTPPHSQQLPLLHYKKVPVQYLETAEGDSTKVDFWTAKEAGVPMTKGILRLYRSANPDGTSRPLVFFLPPSKDSRFVVCKTFCRYFLDNGMQCAYLEKEMGEPRVGSPAQEDDGLKRNQAPPISVETARRGLDALESMGVIRPGEKIGVGGVSMGAIEASLIALTDKRVGAAALLLGGGNIAKMLTSINGSGVNSYMRLRERLLKERGWTAENLERELTPYTTKWDPLAYIKAIPEGQRLAPDRFLMINVKGDQAISNERSDDLYNALTDSNGRHPNRHYITVLVPAAYKHIGAALRLGNLKKNTAKHFLRYLMPQSAPGKQTGGQ